MRKPTFAVMTALVIGCGGASSPSESSDASNSDSSSGSSGGSSGGGSGGGDDASSDAAGPGPGCPPTPPMFGSPCTPLDAGQCSYSNGRYGEVCFCSNQGDGGYAWSCAVGGGRRPAGFAETLEPLRGSALATYLASSARLEAVSVDAFRILRRELAAHGAPRKLLRRASRASRDERRHARTMKSLGRRWGAKARCPEVAAGPIRDLGTLAAENAVEGCVRETYGALLATWQAAHARDRGVRVAMKEIAREETQHASLSWEVGRWAEAKLDPEARKGVTEARRQAIDALSTELAVEPPRELVETLGLPTAAQAKRLLAGMVRSLQIAA